MRFLEDQSFSICSLIDRILLLCHILMTDPVQLAEWQFETPEVSQMMFHESNFVIVDWISASSMWITLTLGRSLQATVAKSTELCTTIDPLPLFLTYSLNLAFTAPLSSTTPLPCEFAKYLHETARFSCCKSRYRSFHVINWFFNSLDGPSE